MLLHTFEWWTSVKMRWWVVLCIAGLWDTASLQPTKDNGPDRECCPCPKDSAVDSTNALAVSVVEDQSPAGSSGARAAGGCPCQLRSADAVSAPSAFLPAAVRAIRPFVSSDDSKEDPKPLLHPEVDLASSVLDTLREATNEEYEDALARDAARAAQEPDEIAAESAHNLVTVVINPKDTSQDDIMQEASHVHDARCINPLGRSSLSLRAPAYNSPDLLTDILRLPKRQPSTFRAWNLFDMDSGVGASNINERVVEPIVEESGVDTPITLPTEDNTSPPQPQSMTLRVPSLFKNTNIHESSDGDLAASILNKLKQPKKVSTKLEISDLSKLIPRMDTSHIFGRAGDTDISPTSNSINTNKPDSPSAFKLQIPHISTLIPKIDLSNLRRKTEEEKINRTNDSENRNIEKAIKLDVPRILTQKSDEDAFNSGIRDFNNLKTELPNLKPNDLFNQRATDDKFNSDSLNSASTVQERYSSFDKSNIDSSNDSKNSAVTSNDYKMPAVKFLNLKSIEEDNVENNISKKKIGLNLKGSDLKLAPLRSRDATSDFINNILKGLQVPNLSNLISSDIFNLRNNDLSSKSTDQKETPTVVPDNLIATKILDTVPSPTEPETSHVNIVEKEREDDIINSINEEMQDMIEEMPVKTEILDTLPKSSELSEIDDSKDPEITEVSTENDDLINAANEITPKSLAKDEETSELVNEIEEMNEDSIDDVIDGTNNEVMDRGNQAENTREGNIVRGSLDEIENDDFVSENKIDGLAINSDIQSLSEKSVPETSFVSNQHAAHSLRDRLRQKIESLKLAPTITPGFPKISGIVKLPKDQTQSVSLDEDGTTNKQEIESETNENVNQVNIEDLQKMSDSLLNLEKEQINAAVEETANPEITNIQQSNLIDDFQTKDNIVIETNNVKSINKVDNACIVNDTHNKNTESDTDSENDSKNNEMAASERVVNIADPDFNLSSPLRQSIILEPTSFGTGFSLFNRPNLDLSNLLNNHHNPFHIPNLLKAREDSNFNPFSINDGGIEDVFNPTRFSAQSSTPDFKLSLPPLQPLEDINLDILQLKPMSADMPTLPGMNLNSFKTRLALPKSLDLKPVLLESSVGNKKGVIGATLTLGSGKELDRSNSLQQASSSLKSSNILRQSLGALPSLDELHETLLENAQNLLSTPIETTGRNAVEDTLRSSQVLTDNLRVQAENAVKDIQQNLASTFRGAELHSHGGLGSIRSSSDLLEDITRRHEDVNDKLKGISVDLSDRLESLRDNILDQYRIPSLGSSILGQSRLFSLGSAIPKQSSTLSSFKKPSQNTLKFSSKGKFVNPATKRKSSSRTSNNKNKLKTASSSSAPKTIEIPKLRTAPTESTVLKVLQKEPNSKIPQFLSRDRPTLSILQPGKNLINLDRPLIKKPRLGQSKVKISFSTTPLPPTLRSKSSFRADSKLNAKPMSLKDSLSKLSRSSLKDKKGSKLSTLRDSSGFASEAIPSKVKAPFTSGLRTAKEGSDRTIINSILTTTLKPVTKPYLGKISDSEVDRPATLLKPKSLLPDTESKTESVLRNTEISLIPALSWPKKLDDEFLTKVRAALRARLAEIGKKSIKPITEPKLGSIKPSTDVDMARSASNNIEVVDPQIMKENTSYTCKMMCTKNT